MASIARAQLQARASSGIARRAFVPAVSRVPAVRVVMMAAQPVRRNNRPSSVSHALLAANPPPTGHPTDAVWLQEKLNDVLSGLETATRRARVKALRVLHVTGARMSYSPATQRPRCTGLDLDIAWEAEPLGPAALAAKQAGQESLHGMARVKLTTRGGDRVEVTDVQVMDRADEDDATAPSMPSSKATPPDVLLAVQSLDGAIMEQLNGFMWELEQAQASTFPLASFELDEEQQDDPPFDPASYTTDTAGAAAAAATSPAV